MRRLTVLGLGLLLLISCNNDHGKPYTLGAAIADFRLETLDRDRFYFNQYRGKTLVLVFWATYCSPCKQQLKDLNGLQAALQNNNIVVAPVVIDPENKDLLMELANQMNLKFPILLDWNQKIAGRFGVPAVPTTAIINPKGRLALLQTGYSELIAKRIYLHLNLKDALNS